MNNVIRVEFSKKKVMMPQYVFEININLTDLTYYLTSLHELGVDEDDILDIIDAIKDMDYYFDADDDIRQFANGYLNQFL